VIPQIQLTTLVYLFAGVMAVALLLDGTQVTDKLFRQTGIVSGLVSLLLLAFDKWAWSFRVLHPWFVAKPNIKGTWKGVLHSNYIDPMTNQPVPPIVVYLVVRQSYSTLHLRLLTRQSSSESVANSIAKDPDGVYTVASLYRNTPKLEHRDHSPIHHGAMLLRIEGDPVESMRAEYWTDRLTRGTIEFSEKSDTLHFDFETASRSAYRSKAPPAVPQAGTTL
jgi:hypothetical protein